MLFLTIASCNEDIEIKNTPNNDIPDNNDIVNNIPEIIRNIPQGIDVYHDPDTIYAEIYYKDTSRYIWKHSTIVSTDIDSLKIIDFGTYNFKNGKWVLGNYSKKSFTTEDFEKWYFVKNEDGIISWENCKNGILRAGTEYIDPSSWSVINTELVSRYGLWYYIGIDPDSNKYMGYGTYVIMPQLKPL